MEGETKLSVKLEAKDEMLLVPRVMITRLNKPECQLCSREIGAVLGLEAKAGDIDTDIPLPDVHIKKEPEDTSDQKIVTDLLSECKFCDRTKEEEEREMIAGLIAEADEISADLLLSDTTIKKEPEDTKDRQVIEDLLGFCRLCDIEDKELALALQPVHSNVEESTKTVSGSNRLMWNAVKKGSGVCGEAEKCTALEATRHSPGSGPLREPASGLSRAPDSNRRGGGEETAQSGYTCSSCAETFSSKYRLVRHVFVHISGVQPPQHVCRPCGSVFPSGRSLQRHLRGDECAGAVQGGGADSAEGRQQAGVYGTEPADQPHHTAGLIGGKVCNETSRLSPSVGCNLQTENPERKCHSGDCKESRRSAFESRVPRNSSAVKRRHTCYMCHKSFTNTSDLKRHMSVHSQKKPFKCIDCGKRFRLADLLRKHTVMHSENLPYTCNECGKSFKRVDTLKKHGLVHTETRSYSCGDCGKSFKSRCGLIVHTRSHIGQKPHECDICGARFTRSHSVVDHRRQHFGERPFKCDVCGATFGRAVTRREHMRAHTGEKPYKCGICGATFAYASVYRKHKRLSSAEVEPKCGDCRKYYEIDNLLEQLGVVRAEKSSHRCINCGTSFIREFELKRPLKCGYCGQLFCLISAIRQHALIHMLKRSYECVNCGNTYKRRDNLKRHQKTGSCKMKDRRKSFSQVDILKKKSYECDDCGNYFIRADSLKRHQTRGWCKANNSDKSSSRVDLQKSRRKICNAKI